MTDPTSHVYLHVPFCARRCSYCDFAIAVRRTVPWQAFARSIGAECEIRGVRAGASVETIYLGGGTPSRLGGEGVGALMGELRRFFVWDETAEVTLEANPDDVTADAVAAWRQAGINRLSLGSQSFDNDVLRWMHRTHDASGIRRAVEIARGEGITALSLDLIFAMPPDVPRHWGGDLEAVLSCAPEHVSLYGLTVEPHTPLGRWHARGEVEEADEERYASEFLEAHTTLVAAGFDHYEVSNFALPGRRARHNSAYWRGVPYLGLGPSAHGFDGHARRWNTAAYAAWEAQLTEGRDPWGGQEELTTENRLAESIYLGLRTTDGLPVDAESRHHVQPWIDAGWLELRSVGGITHVVCTPDGWLRLDALAADLTAFRSPP